MTSFYTRDELEQIGFQSLGENVNISRKCSIYSPGRISIGNNVRIDDFCILSGKIVIGNYVHIASYCSLMAGNGGIIMEDFSAISAKGSVYAATDDYSGMYMTNPTVPDQYRGVWEAEVRIEKHSIIGASCVILPGVVIREGSSCGAMTLVNKSTEAWSINVGVPIRRIGNRKRNLLELEKQFMEKQCEGEH